jgi:hypothetical protein
MSIAAYRKKRTTIIEVEGLRLRVRSLGVEDFAGIGNVPNAFIEAKGNPENLKSMSSEDALKNASYLGRMQKTVLCSCVVIVGDDDKPTGEKIVDKLPEDCGEKEISWREFATPDAVHITNAATKLSGLSKETAIAATPFPEKP